MSFEGRWHKITDVGINPLPVQRPIPVWFGGLADPVLRRVAKLGDGWIVPSYHTNPEPERVSAIGRIREYATQEDRDPDDIGIEKVFGFDSDHTGDLWPGIVSTWRDLGATRACISTMEDHSLTTFDAHIDAISLFKESTSGL